MLGKLMQKLPRRSKAPPVPPATLRLRRAYQPSGRQEPSGQVQEPAIALVHPAPELEAPVSQAAPTSIDVTSDKQLPNWRGILTESVRDPATCVVLDLEYRSVMVLGTSEHFGSGAHNALISTLKAKNFSIEGEKTTTKEVIAAVRAQAQQRAQSARGLPVESTEANVQLYKDLVSGAFRLGGSDLHILLDFEARSKVKVRIDGKSRRWREFDTAVLNAALAAGYNSLTIRGTNSNPDWTTDREINTITRFYDGATAIHGRLSTQTVTGGCKVVIRVSEGDSDDASYATLEDSGFTDEQIQQQLLPALSREQGFFLIGGSTGSGKTTTLQRAILAMPDRETKEIVAVEDPNEKRVPDVAHHSIQRNTDDPPERVKLQFESAFMTQMRMDPDVIMVGEVRDQTSADMAADAVLTGHLLMMTMHGNSAIGQLLRLVRKGVDVHILADEENFALSMAQRLVPKLCEHCKVPAQDVMSERDLSLLRTRWSLDTRKMFCASGTGCPHCTREGIAGDGEMGRTVAAEIITRPTQDFFDCLRNLDRAGAEHAWRMTRRAGFDSPDMWGKTSFENALYHVSRGIVSPLSLTKVFGKPLADFTVVETAELMHLATERAA